VLIYDGECGFCRRRAGWARRHVDPDMAMRAWQDADLDVLGLTADQCQTAVQWVDPSGRTYSGGAAICAALRTGAWHWRTIGVIGSAPGVRVITEWTYRWVARNRHRF
jgi:predicted DCC family thiol-disulfide oxidoreductase YuxK